MKKWAIIEVIHNVQNAPLFRILFIKLFFDSSNGFAKVTSFFNVNFDCLSLGVLYSFGFYFTFGNQVAVIVVPQLNFGFEYPVAAQIQTNSFCSVQYETFHNFLGKQGVKTQKLFGLFKFSYS